MGAMTSLAWQPAILEPVPAVGRFLAFDLVIGRDPRPALARLRDRLAPAGTVVGAGSPLVHAAGARIPGLRPLPALCGPGCAIPSTQAALWAFVGGAEPSDVHDRACAVRALLGDDVTLAEEVAAFRYAGGRDLTGYEDGTENPKDDAAIAAAIVHGAGAGLDGASFVAGQRWRHDLDRFAARSEDARDQTIGRRRRDNEELGDAPPSAHVKRTAQESFDPPAFMVRRSMPWGGLDAAGLYFVAYGASLDRFERALRRMVGEDDGVVDGLFGFTRPVGGGYYWCPPLAGDRLDWSALGV
jgi:porphyrinogen peroxidase